ncbi:MAG: phosphatidate cytidylyltransferase [Promethearchaeota archaeon]
MHVISLMVLCLFYVLSFILFYISFYSKRNKEKQAFINNIVVSGVFFLSLSINILIRTTIQESQDNFILFPFNIAILLFTGIFLLFFYLFIKREKKLIEKSLNKKEFISSNYQLPFKYDIYRKLTHLVVLAIVFFYFTLGLLIQILIIDILKLIPELVSDTFSSYTIHNINMLFTQNLVMFLVGISVIGLITADAVRILKPEYYPLKPVNRILREKELHLRLGPQISMAVGCFSIIIVFGLFQPYGPYIICLSMTMAIFSDMAANIIGRSLGKRKIRNTSKTWEGLFAGISAAFISGLIANYFLNQFYQINIITSIILSFLGASIIGFLDYLDLEIDDNLLFNVIPTIILFLFYYFVLY